MLPKTLRAKEMDTDSFLMALTEKSLYECFTNLAKTEMKENDDFYQRQEDCCQPNAKMNVLTRSSSQKHIALDKRTHGLSKIECNATEMICLNSKT